MERSATLIKFMTNKKIITIAISIVVFLAAVSLVSAFILWQSAVSIQNKMAKEKNENQKIINSLSVIKNISEEGSAIAGVTGDNQELKNSLSSH